VGISARKACASTLEEEAPSLKVEWRRFLVFALSRSCGQGCPRSSLKGRAVEKLTPQCQPSTFRHVGRAYFNKNVNKALINVRVCQRGVAERFSH
jgi:hypothetical protein